VQPDLIQQLFNLHEAVFFTPVRVMRLVFVINMTYETTKAAGADLPVAHHAIPEAATGVARNLRMSPTVIGNIAAAAGVKQLVLAHRMTRTFGKEQQTTQFIRKHYAGPLALPGMDNVSRWTINLSKL
jgi:ribonuclease BN (tRNA processing enzyme)